jgi:hypothetical protein
MLKLNRQPHGVSTLCDRASQDAACYSYVTVT